MKAPEEQLRPPAGEFLRLDDYPDALIAISVDGLILEWSSGAERLFEFSREEAVDHSLLELIVPPEFRDAARRETEHALTSGQSIYEGVRRRKDGSVVYVDGAMRVVRDVEGGIRFIAVSKRDVTLLKYQRDGRILERQFRGLLEAAPDVMVLVNRDGRIVLANTQVEAMFGWHSHELIGQPVEILVPERFRSQHPEQSTFYFADPGSRPMAGPIELYGRRRDGTEFPVGISLSPMESDIGPLVTAAIRDNTARQRVEAKFRGLLEAAPDAIVIVNRAGRIALVNGQAEHLFGYPREELLGQPVELLVPLRLSAGHPAHRTAYFENPRLRPMGRGLELSARRKDGSEVAVEISLSPLETEDGTLVTAAIRDISQRKQLEARRRQSDELAIREAQEANRLKSEFLANMSHELRTPLNAIIGFSQLMRDGKVGPLAAVHQEYLGDILTSAQHLLRLINDVLDLAKVEAGRIEFSPELVRLPDLANEVGDIVRTLAAARRIALTVESDPALPPALIDPSKLKQVFYNYLSNALKFTPEEGRVTVRIAPEGAEEFRLEVEDSGPGIRPEDLGRLFVEFQQLDAGAAKKYQGTGLGLALTRRLVEAQGGRVGVRSQLGEGSVFHAILPLRSRMPATQRSDADPTLEERDAR